MGWRHVGSVGLFGLLVLHCGGSNATSGDNPGSGGDDGTGTDGGPSGTGKDGGHASKDGGHTGSDGGTVGDDDDSGPVTGGDSGGKPTSCLADHTDNMAASINPPGGLQPSQVPMFVMLGFDDNAHADGMNWVTSTLLGGKKNADGSPALATFFVIGGAATTDNAGVFNPAGGQTEQDLIDSWKAAYAAGHEIGNHTWDHADGGDARTIADWNTEISKANDSLVSLLGIPQCQLVGWRFPYLHFDDAGFQGFGAANYKYDTSIEFGYDWWQPPGMTSGFGNSSPEYGKHYWWPFTLDNGLDSSFACCSKGVQPHPGLWEFPVHAFTRPDPADSTKVKTVTGLDYNLWTAKASVDTSIDFCATLKYSLDQRYDNNRSPFNLGVHSDIYSQFNPVDDTAFLNTYDVRRAGLQCFVDYALTKPDVRLVTFKTVVEWLRAPKAIH